MCVLLAIIGAACALQVDKSGQTGFGSKRTHAAPKLAALTAKHSVLKEKHTVLQEKHADLKAEFAKLKARKSAAVQAVNDYRATMKALKSQRQAARKAQAAPVVQAVALRMVEEAQAAPVVQAAPAKREAKREARAARRAAVAAAKQAAARSATPKAVVRTHLVYGHPIGPLGSCS